MIRDVSWNVCGTGGCLVAFRDGDTVVVFDGKLGPQFPIQRWDVEDWAELVRAVRHDRPYPAWVWSDDFAEIRFGRAFDPPLTFSADEWDKFTAGVLAGDFEPNNLPIAPVAVPSAAEGVAGLSPAAHPEEGICAPLLSDETGEGGPGDPPSPVDPTTAVAGTTAAAAPAEPATGEGGGSSVQPLSWPSPVAPSSGAPIDSPAGQGGERGEPVAKRVTSSQRAGQPGPGPRNTARKAVVAFFEEHYGEPVVIDDFRQVLYAYADVAVDAFLTATWAEAISPLVPISEASSTGDEGVAVIARRPATTGPGGIEGEVAPDLRPGATEPDDQPCCECGAVR